MDSSQGVDNDGASDEDSDISDTSIAIDSFEESIVKWTGNVITSPNFTKSDSDLILSLFHSNR